MLLFAPSFGRILLTPHLFVTVPSSYRRGCLRSLSLSLFLFIPLAQHPRSRAILRNASQLSPVLPFSSRGSLSLSHRRLDSPAPPFSVCRSLSAAAAAAAGRRIERKRTRTGPKQPPVNRDRFPLSPLSSFVVHPRRPSCHPPPFLRSPGKLYNAKCYPRVALFGSLFLHLPLFLSLAFLWLRAGPLFSVVLASSFARCSSPATAFRARFIPTRPCGNVSSTAILGFFSFGLFLASSNFSRASNIKAIFQRAKIPRENCRAVRIKYRYLRSI